MDKICTQIGERSKKKQQQIIDLRKRKCNATKCKVTKSDLEI